MDWIGLDGTISHQIILVSLPEGPYSFRSSFTFHHLPDHKHINMLNTTSCLVSCKHALHAMHVPYGAGSGGWCERNGGGSRRDGKETGKKGIRRYVATATFVSEQTMVHYIMLHIVINPSSRFCALLLCTLALRTPAHREQHKPSSPRMWWRSFGTNGHVDVVRQQLKAHCARKQRVATAASTSEP